jgi:ATP synthase protein I
MLANDARILTRSAMATAITGVILVALGAAFDGRKGVLGALFGVILVAAFFSLSVLAVSFAGRWGPAAMTATALGTYVVKILAVAILVASLRNATAFNTRFFGITAIICILVWSAGQIVTLARRGTPYVVPEASTLPAGRELSGAPGPPGVAGASGDRDLGGASGDRVGAGASGARDVAGASGARDLAGASGARDVGGSSGAREVSIAAARAAAIAAAARAASTSPDARQSGGEP